MIKSIFQGMSKYDNIFEQKYIFIFEISRVVIENIKFGVFGIGCKIIALYYFLWQRYIICISGWIWSPELITQISRLPNDGWSETYYKLLGK